jgi:hypothetical protein
MSDETETDMFFRILKKMDYETLTKLEHYLASIKDPKKRALELQTKLQEDWDRKHPSGVDGKRRLFKVEEDRKQRRHGHAPERTR